MYCNVAALFTRSPPIIIVNNFHRERETIVLLILSFIFSQVFLIWKIVSFNHLWWTLLNSFAVQLWQHLYNVQKHKFTLVSETFRHCWLRRICMHDQFDLLIRKCSSVAFSNPYRFSCFSATWEIHLKKKLVVVVELGWQPKQTTNYEETLNEKSNWSLRS